MSDAPLSDVESAHPPVIDRTCMQCRIYIPRGTPVIYIPFTPAINSRIAHPVPEDCAAARRAGRKRT